MLTLASLNEMYQSPVLGCRPPFLLLWSRADFGVVGRRWQFFLRVVDRYLGARGFFSLGLWKVLPAKYCCHAKNATVKKMCRGEHLEQISTQTCTAGHWGSSDFAAAAASAKSAAAAAAAARGRHSCWCRGARRRMAPSAHHGAAQK